MTFTTRQLDDGSFRMTDGVTGNTVMEVEGTSRVAVFKTASLARTDTSAKNLFTLPKNAVPFSVNIYSGTAADPAGTATISIGKTGTGTFFVATTDVKGVSGQITPVATNLMVSVGTSAIQVIGIYAESSTASTTGGPFHVRIGYYVA